MNGAHDLGGMAGFGPVPRKQQDHLFEHDWQRRVFGLSLGVGTQGLFKMDESRYAIELMDPADYLGSSYYEHWLAGLETRLQNGVIDGEEYEQRTREFAEGRGRPAPTRPKPELVRAFRSVVIDGNVVAQPRAADRAPRFAAGDCVRVRDIHPRGHTRLPRYLRGRAGVVERVLDPCALPETNAHDLGENTQHTYTVRFDSRELWGESAEPSTVVSFDAWEDYLEPDPTG